MLKHFFGIFAMWEWGVLLLLLLLLSCAGVCCCVWCHSTSYHKQLPSYDSRATFPRWRAYSRTLPHAHEAQTLTFCNLAHPHTHMRCTNDQLHPSRTLAHAHECMSMCPHTHVHKSKNHTHPQAHTAWRVGFITVYNPPPEQVAPFIASQISCRITVEVRCEELLTPALS